VGPSASFSVGEDVDAVKVGNSVGVVIDVIFSTETTKHRVNKAADWME
jgi:uncharacterized protein YrrD